MIISEPPMNLISSPCPGAKGNTWSRCGEDAMSRPIWITGLLLAAILLVIAFTPGAPVQQALSNPETIGETE